MVVFHSHDYQRVHQLVHCRCLEYDGSGSGQCLCHLVKKICGPIWHLVEKVATEISTKGQEDFGLSKLRGSVSPIPMNIMIFLIQIAIWGIPTIFRHTHVPERSYHRHSRSWVKTHISLSILLSVCCAEHRCSKFEHGLHSYTCTMLHTHANMIKHVQYMYDWAVQLSVQPQKDRIPSGNLT